METFLEELKRGVILAIREIDEKTDIFFEEIIKTEREDDSLKDYYFIDLIPKIETVDKIMSDVSVLVDVAYHEASEKNSGYLKMIGSLDSVLRPALRIGDRTATIDNIDYKIVDKVLHVTFFLNLRLAKQIDEDGEFTEDLVFNVKGE